MLTTFPQCNFPLEFPEINSVSGISKIMHCGTIINMPYRNGGQRIGLPINGHQHSHIPSLSKANSWEGVVYAFFLHGLWTHERTNLKVIIVLHIEYFYKKCFIELQMIFFGMKPHERSKYLSSKSTKPTNLTPPVVSFGLAVACHDLPYKMKIYTEFNWAT